MPWPIPDYAAAMWYHIGLFINSSQHLRAWGQRSYLWVEAGQKSQHIFDVVAPKVTAGLGTLVTELNQKLSSFDGALGAVTDVYYLPGRQQKSIATGVMTGNTGDDVTIVIEH